MKLRSSRFVVRSLIALTTIAIGCISAQAQVTVYSNVTSFSGSALPNGGAAAGGGGFITRMVADDLNLAGSTVGTQVTGFSFSMANFNTSTVSARPIANFYASNGAGGGPGTLLATITFNAISMMAGSVQVFNFNPGSAIFTVPTSTIWAGLMFDNGGVSTATQSQLNNFGQGIFNPPTIGSSADVYFQSTSAGPSGSNPAGGFSNFGGSPRANFGWAINIAASVPETGSTILMLLAGIGGLLTLKRRFR